MSAFPNSSDLLHVLPELIWCVFGALLMILQPLTKSRPFLTTVAVMGALLGICGNFYNVHNPGQAFSGLIAADPFSIFFSHLVGLIAVMVILGAGSYLERERLADAEFYALVLFATAGMGVLASAQELLTAFIGLEMSSISSYVLAGYRRDTLKSGESSMKYFLLGSFATAFFLYGIALVYGVTGTTNLLKMDAAGPKAATFALLLRIFADVPAATQFWFYAFWILAALTMFAGNLGALLQTNVKRMLAYSSIAHAGYILVAFAAVTSLKGTEIGAGPAYAAVLFYLLSYALVKVGAFTIVSQFGGAGEKHLALDDYAGLGERQPFVAAALSLFLLSLLGLPITAGFFGKFYVFKAAVDSHLIWLAVLMAANSIIGAYYYIRLIVIMYMRDPIPEVAPTTPVRFPAAVNVVLAIAVIGTLWLGLLPSKTLNYLLQTTLINTQQSQTTQNK